MADDGELIAFLGSKAFRLVSSVADPELRDRVRAAIEAAAGALTAVDMLDLSPYELAEEETANVATWESLAPDVGHILMEVRSAGSRLEALFPAGEAQRGEASAADLESAFDIMASADPQHAGAAQRRDQALDQVVRGSSAASIAEAGEGISTLVTVLHQDTLTFGAKLRNPAIMGDRWSLLAELHNFLHQCAQCLEAIVATILGALTTKAIEEVLPRYTTATGRAIALRASVADLAYAIEQINIAVAKASGDQLRAIKGDLEGALDTFIASPAYKGLTPQDKRPLISLRWFLSSWERKGADPVRLRQEIEGFSKFLVLMSDLNWRELLQESDAHFLGDAEVVLDSEMDLELALPYLSRVYGRAPAIDAAVRSMRSGQPVGRPALLKAVRAMLAQRALG